MIPFTSQQRLQHRLGIDLNDHTELEIDFDAPCAALVAERLDRLISGLPTRYARLERASKYSSQPAIRPIRPEDVSPEHRATIAVAMRREDSLAIRFAPLVWDVFSILRLLQVSLGSVTGAVQTAPAQLFQGEASVQSRWDAPSANPIALASPKIYRGGEGAHRRFERVAIDAGRVPAGPELTKSVAARSFREGDLICELPIALDLEQIIGNLSYFVPSSGVGEMLSPADQLASHALLARQPEVVLPGIAVTELPYISGVASIAFRGPLHGIAAHVVVYQSPTQLAISATYSAAAFSERESSNHFRDLVGAFQQRRTCPVLAPRTQSDENNSISEMLLRGLSLWPDQVAVRTPGRSYSRFELLESARAIAAQIPGETERIGIYCRNSFEYVAAVAGCILNGTCYVPLDRNAGSARLRDIVESASLDLMLCTADDESAVRALGGKPLVVRDGLTGATEPLGQLKKPGLIYRIYTSGTTGKPKPVDVSDSNLRALFLSYSDISPEIYSLAWGFTSSIGFDASVKQYLGPLLFGGIVFVPSMGLTQDTVAVLRELKTHSVDVLNLTPQLLRIAVDADLCDFRFVLVSGDVLPPRLVEDFHKRTSPPVQLVNLYGPTETTINAMAYCVARDMGYHSLPIGQPLGGCTVEVDNASGERQPYCVRGSLKIFGDIVTSGHRHPGGDRFGWRDGIAYFDTGDECFVWYDDLAYFVGRNDRQIKVSGIRVNLEEMTNWLREYLSVATCYVGALGSRIYAVLLRQEVAGKEDRISTLADTTRFGRLTISPIIVEAIPVDVNGKVNLAALLATQNEPSALGGDPAQDILELEVHTVVQTALDRRNLDRTNTCRLGVNDHLFEHGVDSLLAMELALDLSTRLNVELSPGELTSHPTSRGIARLLQQRRPRPTLFHMAGLTERKKLVLLLPPVLGSSLVFNTMIEKLSEDHLVAACSYPTASGDAPNIEQIARAIAAELRCKDLLGHCIDVVGYSMGGSVGFELCKQIEREAVVTGLYILDKPVTPRGDLRAQQRAGAALLDGFLAARSVSHELRMQLSQTMQRNIDVVFDYVPTGSVSVPTHLFVCTQEERPVRLDEWAPYLRGEQTVTRLDCLHGQILASPHVDVVLASLAATHASNQRTPLSTPVLAE